MSQIRAGLYMRVSTPDQVLSNQQLTLHAYAQARGWQVTEFSDIASGARERRPGLDALMAAARKRQVDAVVIVRLDRLARSIHHLLTLSRELEELGVDLVVTDQAIDTSTSVGKLLFTLLGAVAAFELDLTRERITAGIRRARHEGKRIGRPRVHVDVPRAKALLGGPVPLSIRATAQHLRVSRSTLTRALLGGPKGSSRAAR